MLKLILITLTFLMSLSVFACWKVEGSLGVDGETWKFHQKIDHDKEYLFPLGTFTLKMKVSAGKEKKHTLNYAVVEKKGVTLTLVTLGTESIEEEKSKDIYAKGEPNQPHSIIIVKLTKI